jgi:hypothetical protein
MPPHAELGPLLLLLFLAHAVLLALVLARRPLKRARRVRFL